MKINRKTKQKNEISTSSLPDIIFMLLIFFMVTTVMREFEGLDVVLPRAEKIEKRLLTLDERDAKAVAEHEIYMKGLREDKARMKAHTAKIKDKQNGK